MCFCGAIGICEQCAIKYFGSYPQLIFQDIEEIKPYYRDIYGFKDRRPAILLMERKENYFLVEDFSKVLPIFF